MEEEVEEDHREVVRVRVGVAELIGDGVEGVIAAFRVQGGEEDIEEVHTGVVREGGGG